MLTTITSKSYNPQQEQGDSSSKGGVQSERELFAQFTDILDKIASSLSHAKKNNDNQMVNDMGSALGQAAATQIQRPIVIERQFTPQESKAGERDVTKKVSEPHDQPRTDILLKPGGDTQSLKQDSSRPDSSQAKVPQTSVAPAAGVKEVTEAQSTQQQEPQLAQQVSQAQVPSTAAVVDTHSAQSIESTVESQLTTEEAVVTPPSTTQSVAVNETEEAVEVAPVDEAFSQSDVTLSDAKAAQPVKAEHVDSHPVIQNKDRPAIANQAHATTDEQPQIEQGAGVTEQELPQPELLKTTDVAEQIKSAQAVQAKTVVSKTNEELLVQSIEALLHQVAFAGATNQAAETLLSPKGAGNSRQVLGIQATSNGQMLTTASGEQARPGQIIREKVAARELPRPLALKTMERVESALKEVARSKDGKTISLRLDPPSLGTLKIDVSLKDGQLHARFVGESAQVNTLLREQSHELQQMLRKAGVQAERILISVANDRVGDFNEGFQKFDQQTSPQFRESSSRQGEFGDAPIGKGDSISQVTSQRPVDHWVA